MFLKSLCLFLSISLSAQQIDQKHIDRFKQLKADDNFIKFCLFVQQLKKEGLTSGQCIEAFVEQKKMRALSAIYTQEEIQKLQEKLKIAEKKRQESGLHLHYDDDVPEKIQVMLDGLALENNVCANITVFMNNETGVSLACDKDLIFRASAIYGLLFKEDYGIFGNHYYLGLNKQSFILDQHEASMRCALRHELRHITAHHSSINTFYLSCKKKPSLEQKNKLTKALETEADLMPLAYASIEVAKEANQKWERDAKIFEWMMHLLKNRQQETLALDAFDDSALIPGSDDLSIGIFKNHLMTPTIEILTRIQKILEDNIDHPSFQKRANRAIIIQKIKEAENACTDPFGYIAQEKFNFFKKAYSHLLKNVQRLKAHDENEEKRLLFIE